jgi:nondiscriminating aspartyl-tRNA synthetase
MKRILIEEAKQQTGETVTIAGWVQIIRDQGTIKFILIRDRSGVIQVIVAGKKEKSFEVAAALTKESVVEISGVVKKEKQAPDGIEIAATNITVLSHADPELPIQVVEKGSSEASQEKRLDWRWLDLRKPEKQLIFNVWTAMEHAFREYWVKNGFTQIHSPKMMSTPSESKAELFEVPYFERKAYLAQSPQFYKQMAIASGFEKVFEIGPVFRANPSFTSRHDTEFTSYDVEMGFISSHQDVMAAQQEMIVAALTAVKEQYGDQIKQQYGRDVVVPTIPFPHITMEEAKELLAHKNIKSEREGDLSPEEERELSALIKEKHHHEFVYVTEYPIAVRPFYHMRFEDKPDTTKSFDLLWNGIEITTGAQREHRYETLKQQAQEKGLSLEPIQFYLNFFKYGCPPHGGFGLGPSRMLMKIFDAANVREVTLLYRGVRRLAP